MVSDVRCGDEDRRMRNIRCRDCEEYRNEWCEKVVDSPCPDMERDCQYFHEKDPDMVKVVRCKDCKHGQCHNPDGTRICGEFDDATMHDEDFCSRAEPWKGD